jgi:hypothetical protein
VPTTTTPCWLTNLLLVTVVLMVAFALATRLVYGWSVVAVLALAAIVVLGTATAPEARSLAAQLLQALVRRKPSDS